MFSIHKYRMPLSILILLFGAGWIWISAVPAGGTTTQEITVPRKGFLAPDFSLQGLDGELVTLSELRGQAVLVNFWASWCPPCQAEMPVMQDVYQSYRDQGFVILAVNATSQDSASAVEAYAEENQLTFPILFDVAGSTSRSYNVFSMPTTFFVDPDGIIREVIVGGPMSETLLRTRVESILPELP
jgi:cytochrome c biogenesis protein CcmG/thiol:disulfide interchange protein DsbE